MERRKKFIRRTILTIIIAGLAAIAILAGIILNTATSYEKEELDETKIEKNVEAEEIKEYTGYTTIALFGLDNRDIGNLNEGRSDVIMLLSINNDTEEIKIVSVYRDTYMNIGEGEGPEYQKANAAYAFGGPEQAITMLNKNLDLDIDDYISFDFNAVAKVIDKIGGVTVEITDEAERKELNRVIEETNEYLDGNSETIDEIGTHTLDGVQAVAYGRIRKLDGGDYKRAQRQRIVLTKMADKLQQSDAATLLSVVREIMPDVKSSLSVTDLTSMAKAMISYDLEESIGFPFERANKNIKSVGATVVPCDLFTNVQELHEYLYGIKNYMPSDVIGEYSDYMINRTGCTTESAEEDGYENLDDFSGDAPKSQTSESPQQ